MARRPADQHELCGCGHSRNAHEHYRRGTDCAVCGSDDCRRFIGTGARATVEV